MVRRSWLHSLLIVTCIHCQRRRSSRVVQMLKVRPLQEAIVSSSAHNSKSRSLFTSHVTYTFSLEQMQKTSLLGFFLLFLQLYSGIFTNMANSGNSVQPRGKSLTDKIVSVRSNICITQQGLGLLMNKVSWISEMVTVRWWPVILLELTWNNPWHMTVIMTFTFCCDNLWKHSLWLWKKPGKLWGIFFSYFVFTLRCPYFFLPAFFRQPFSLHMAFHCLL